MFIRVTYLYTFLPILGSKFKVQMAENLCSIFLTCVKSTLNGPANGPSVNLNHLKRYKVRMFSCKSCKLEFNNDEARISHEPICSGDPSTRKCKKCQKIMSVKKYKNHKYCT